jgi:hypothetical protein
MKVVTLRTWGRIAGRTWMHDELVMLAKLDYSDSHDDA